MCTAECPGEGAGQCWTQAPSCGHMKTEATLRPLSPEERIRRDGILTPSQPLFKSTYLFACLFLRQSHSAAPHTCLYACLCLLSDWMKGMCPTCWGDRRVPPSPVFPLFSLLPGWRGVTEKFSCCSQHGDKGTVGSQVPSIVCFWQGMRLKGDWRSLPVCPGFTLSISARVPSPTDLWRLSAPLLQGTERWVGGIR